MTVTGLKLVRTKDKAVGRAHRQGWPTVFSALEKYAHPQGILFDDFVDQNFSYNRDHCSVYREPWAGIFHHPPGIPGFARHLYRPEIFLKSAAFRRSAVQLRLAVCLSHFLSRYLKKHLKCPILTLRHPAEPVALLWDQNRYRKAGRPVAQLGSTLRNTRLIYQLDLPNRKRLLQRSQPGASLWDSICRRRFRHRRVFPGVEECGYVKNDAYDKLLASSVIVQETLASSANNGVLDCIVRNTPLVINRHPAVEEYLGTDYPLFWSETSEIPGLIARAAEGHEYLKAMDKSWTSRTDFAAQIVDRLRSLDICLPPRGRATRTRLKPWKHYILCGSPDTGSSLLCNVLAQAGFGKSSNSMKYLVPSMSRKKYLSPARDKRQLALFARGLMKKFGKNHRFGINLHWEHVAHNPFLQKMLPALFPQALFIFLDRKDRLRQAIFGIQARLRQASLAGRSELKPVEAVFNRPLIDERIQAAQYAADGWEQFFLRNRIDPLRFTYEDLERNCFSVVEEILYCLDERPRPVPQARLPRRLDNAAQPWIERYLASP